MLIRANGLNIAELSDMSVKKIDEFFGALVLDKQKTLIAERIIKEQMRKRWVEQMLTEYGDDFEGWSEVVLCDKNRKVIVVYFKDCWGDHYGYGISKCSPTDVFDEDTGIAVAFAHFVAYPGFCLKIISRIIS